MSGWGFGAIFSRARAGVLVGLIVAVFGVGSGPARGEPAEKVAECLKSPKATAPAGERWYYRVERGTKRHCWYTRAEVPRKTAAPVAKPEQTAERPADPVPLQASVANARAEADLSDLPRPGLGSTPLSADKSSESPRWTLADRWSNRVNDDPPVQSTPMRPTPPLVLQTEHHDGDEEPSDDGLRAVAAGTVALLGLSTLLIATLIRRRKRNVDTGNWHFAQRGAQRLEPDLQMTDLNDEPLMTWRKGLKTELRLARQTPGQRDAVIRRIRRLT